MQTALLVGAVDPSIGGILIRGQKGTAKSTAVRALAGLLPSIRAISDCPYHCDPNRPDPAHPDCLARRTAGDALPSEVRSSPFVELPLSATEDRLVGTLDLEKTLQTGARHFESGLLGRANRGILYVDEVNLLPDHLVDLLLDVAASGVNRVEREGLHFSHPARFLLIGSMNPEEGELRPQFLDRFALSVTVAGLSDPALRRQIVTDRMAFEQDPERFSRQMADQEALLRSQVLAARQRLTEVAIPDPIIDGAVDLAAQAGAQGHRAELAMAKTARALAALCDRHAAEPIDLAEAARLALPHRLADAAVHSAETAEARISELLNEPPAAVRAAEGEDQTEEELDLALLDEVGFPGSAAAGSMLFTYLKKKAQSDISRPKKRSTSAT